jgi:site-specific recombinase XerD
MSAYLWTWIESFLLAKKTENKSPDTLDYYRRQLARFAQYCDSLEIREVTQVTPDDLRRFLIWLQERGRNPGGFTLAGAAFAPS